MGEWKLPLLRGVQVTMSIIATHLFHNEGVTPFSFGEFAILIFLFAWSLDKKGGA